MPELLPHPGGASVASRSSTRPRPAGGLEAAGDTPEDEVFKREFWEQLREGLDALPDEQREAVVFCDLEGMSYEEMAEVMGVPIGTVRSRIFRGRRALQQRLAVFHAASRPGRRVSDPRGEVLRELVSAFVDERLAGPELLLLEEHLAAVAGCHGFEADLRRFRS